MKIVVAPDSFKGSMSALKAAKAMAKGINNLKENIEVTQLPLSDGGDGFLEIITNLKQGTIYSALVENPLGKIIEAKYGILEKEKTGIIEMALASGLTLLKSEERNPLKTSTYGTGQLICKLLDHQCQKIIIGIGGSGTNDGGMGMAKALGAEFFDENGAELEAGGESLLKLKKISIANLDPRLKKTKIIIASDVNNPLTGERGASKIFGPQKGATADEVEILEQALENYGNVIEDFFKKTFKTSPGAGAAGGLGAGLLAFTSAKIEAGIALILKLAQGEAIIAAADLVISGEGSFDTQTSDGKVIYGLDQLCQKLNKPLLILAGKVTYSASKHQMKALKAFFSISSGPLSLEEMINGGTYYLENCTEQVVRAFLLGQSI